MEATKEKEQIETLLKSLSSKVEPNESSNILHLTGNELTDILLKITGDIRNETPVDNLLENTVNIIGKSGLAERVLLFQTDTKAILTHYWESEYATKFNPVGFQLDLTDVPLFKLFRLNERHTVQFEDFSKYLTLPNYLFRNKFKSFFIKLKTKSLLITTGSTEKVKLGLSLQFCTRNSIWSNEVEKLLQAVVDQLVVAIDQNSEKIKKESLEKNIIKLQEKAIKEQEELLKQFASDLHDMPCSIIPNLKKSIKEKDFIECERLVDELHNNLRQLINEYVVPDLNLLGFSTTIYQYLNGFKKTFQGNLFIEMPDEDINLSNKQAVELFKVIKEWFCNIEKHSCATEASFSLKKINECYFLINISDNGKGFDVNDPKNLGYGILNIKHRLKDLNTKFAIQSRLNKGSTLKIQFCAS